MANRIVGNDGNFSIGQHNITANAWTMNVSRVVSDVTAYDDTARAKRGGIAEYTGSASGFMKDGSNDPQIAPADLLANDGVSACTLTAISGCTFAGSVVVSGVSVTSTKTGDATISFDFAFNGDVTEAWA